MGLDKKGKPKKDKKGRDVTQQLMELKDFKKAVKDLANFHGFSHLVKDPKLMTAVFVSFDLDGSGSVDLDEFVRSMVVFTKAEPEQKHAFQFRIADRDNN